MALDILNQKPDDVIEFMKDWLNDNEEDLRRHLGTSLRPEGIDTTESEDEL